MGGKLHSTSFENCFQHTRIGCHCLNLLTWLKITATVPCAGEEGSHKGGGESPDEGLWFRFVFGFSWMAFTLLVRRLREEGWQWRQQQSVASSPVLSLVMHDSGLVRAFLVAILTMRSRWQNDRKDYWQKWGKKHTNGQEWEGTSLFFTTANTGPRHQPRYHRGELWSRQPPLPVAGVALPAKEKARGAVLDQSKEGFPGLSYQSLEGVTSSTRGLLSRQWIQLTEVNLCVIHCLHCLVYIDRGVL